MRNTPILGLLLLTAGQITAQDTTPAAAPARPVFQVLAESTVRQPDGGSITFRQVAPPAVTPQSQARPAPAAASQAAPDQPPEKELQVLSISASVKAGGLTVLRWTCGGSRRLQAVSNVDFRILEGLGGLETAQTIYHLILAAGPDDQPLTDAEVLAAQSLPAGTAAYALLSDGGSTEPAAMSPADAAALAALKALLDHFDTHRQELLQQQARREADSAARELAVRSAPPPPPRRSVIHFWPLQPAQRAAIQENTRREKGAAQP